MCSMQEIALEIAKGVEEKALSSEIPYNELVKQGRELLEKRVEGHEEMSTDS